MIKLDCSMDVWIQEKQVIPRQMMTKKHNSIHFVHTFKIGNIITMTIFSKDWAVNNAPQMEAKIIDIPYINWYWL